MNVTALIIIAAIFAADLISKSLVTDAQSLVEPEITKFRVRRGTPPAWCAKFPTLCSISFSPAEGEAKSSARRSASKSKPKAKAKPKPEPKPKPSRKSPPKNNANTPKTRPKSKPVTGKPDLSKKPTPKPKPKSDEKIDKKVCVQIVNRCRLAGRTAICTISIGTRRQRGRCCELGTEHCPQEVEIHNDKKNHETAVRINTKPPQRTTFKPVKPKPKPKPNPKPKPSSRGSTKQPKSSEEIGKALGIPQRILDWLKTHKKEVKQTPVKGPFSDGKAHDGPCFSLTKFRRQAMQSSNELRKLHGSPPLIETRELNRKAQGYAELWIGKVEREPTLFLPPHSGPGENIYVSSDPELFLFRNGSTGVGLWYDEIKDYDWNVPGKSRGGQIGHFTQLVWAETDEVGHGFAASKDCVKFLVIANYKPPGNLKILSDTELTKKIYRMNVRRLLR